MNNDFICKKFTAKNDISRELMYFEYKPDAAGKSPLIFDIHGAGNIGALETLIDKNSNSSSILNNNFENAIIIKPHSGARIWFEVFETLLELVDTMSMREDVDKNRIYCIGASMGGYTTWQLAMSRPDLFAAIVPICGGGMYWNAAAIKNMPIWAFHGARDTVVLPEESLHMVKAVNDSGGNAKITIYPRADHDAWTPTLNSKEMWEWLFEQSKTEK